MFLEQHFRSNGHRDAKFAIQERTEKNKTNETKANKQKQKKTHILPLKKQ